MKFDGEPVEQLGMRGPFAADAEIVGRAHEPFAEMPLPDAIHDHARGERVLLRRDPFGQRGSPLLGGYAVERLARRQLARKARHCDIAWIR